MKRLFTSRVIGVILVLILVTVVFLRSGSIQSAKADPVNDYPSNLVNAPLGKLVDPWGFDNRYCTSFVAWRLNNNNHIPFKNYNYMSKGKQFGDAQNWKAVALSIGIPVDLNPAVGSVAWFTSNHVAWVSALNPDGTVQIQEYNNPARSGNYNTRSISKNAAWYIHIADLPTSYPSRIGALSGSHFLVKEGGLSAGWVDEYQNVVAGVISDNRIGVLTSNGHFLVKEGGLSSGWVDEYSGVTAGYLSGTRIGVLLSNSHLLVKEGGLSAGWVDEYSGVTAAALSSNRIGVLDNAGIFLVKEGGLSAGWVDEYFGVRTGYITDTRIGVLDNAGIFLVKEGGLSAGWVDEYSGVIAASLSGNRIGVLLSSGNFLVKEGGLSTSWVEEYSNVTEGTVWSST